MDRQTTATADGRYGRIEGLVDDRVVFAHYRDQGDWSPALLDLVCEQLRPRTLIDVGANIGLFSLPVAKRTRATCFAFEPEPANHRLLQRNVAHHGLQDRVRTANVAVYSRTGSLSLRLSPDNSGDHHVDGGGGGGGQGGSGDETVSVPADTLDRLLADEALPGPVVLKIDTQGSELQVLRGARALLPRVDHCVVEYWPAGLGRVGDRPAALRDALSEFPLAALLDQHDSRPQLGPTAALWERLAFLADDDPGFFDLLLTRSTP